MGSSIPSDHKGGSVRFFAVWTPNLTFLEAQFTKDVISVPYDGKMWDFDVYYRDLWELATDLLRDPNLFPHFQFDAQRLSKFDGQTFVRFVDEPFTVEDFWNVQVCIL